MDFVEMKILPTDLLLYKRSLKTTILLTLYASGLALFLSGCQIGYLTDSALNHASLLWHRVPVEKALTDSKISEATKRKLLLAQEARTFATQELKLNDSSSYNSYVELPGPFVTYVVSAAPKDRLEPFHWSFPFVGRVPYKGFFNEKKAKKEAADLESALHLDTYVRGVTAYSTLGWFDDPILSSMISYEDFEFVELVIHETVHGTLYFPNAAEFNERLATFLGERGTEIFYLKKEGKNSKTLGVIQDHQHDTRIFSKFLSVVLSDLDQFYSQKKPGELTEGDRLSRFEMIREKYKAEVWPQLKTGAYRRFFEKQINNARLLAARTYLMDLSDFEEAFRLQNHDFQKLLALCRSFEQNQKPENALHLWVMNQKSKLTNFTPQNDPHNVSILANSSKQSSSNQDSLTVDESSIISRTTATAPETQ